MYRILDRIARSALVAALLVVFGSCHHIDDHRLPPVAVNIAFKTVGEWNIYGVAGATSYRCFIKSQQTPAGYPYTAYTYTGFGGVLLIGDVHGNPIAYDMACPVECRADVRIFVNNELMVGECPVCHSTYDIVTNYGHPLSGTAAQRGYGLEKYYVGPGMGGEYMVISR